MQRIQPSNFIIISDPYGNVNMIGHQCIAVNVRDGDQEDFHQLYKMTEIFISKEDLRSIVTTVVDMVIVVWQDGWFMLHWVKVGIGVKFDALKDLEV